MKNWFLRSTGSPVTIAISDCGCRHHNRPYCYDCLLEKDYTEQPPRLNNLTTKPSWYKKRQKQILTPADVRFLSGIPEAKPFYRKRRQYARSY